MRAQGERKWIVKQKKKKKRQLPDVTKEQQVSSSLQSRMRMTELLVGDDEKIK
jgi:hypothetical protein